MIKATKKCRTIKIEKKAHIHASKVMQCYVMFKQNMNKRVCYLML